MKVEDIDLSKTYMARYYFNSKKITWQPCIVLSKEIKPNQNGFDCIEVKFFNGNTKMVYAKDGEMCDSSKSPSLKPLPENWMKNEVDKINKEIEQLEIKKKELLTLQVREETKTEYTSSELTNASVDAYSRSFYSDAHWHAIISFLLEEGIKPRAIMWILFSKHMRWNDPHTYTEFVKYFTLDKNDIQKDSLENYENDELITDYLNRK